MPDKDDIIVMAEVLLEVINNTFALENHPLPQRQYFTLGGMGQTVHDCDQVTVSWDQIYSGIPGDESGTPMQCNSPKTVTFVVEVVRKICVINSNELNSTTTGTPNIPSRYGSLDTKAGTPEPEDLMRDAEVQMRDAVILLKAGLLAGEKTPQGGAVVDVSAGTPQGGYQAVIMSYTSILGIDPLL